MFQYDRNYTLTYNAGSAGQTLKISWVMTSGSSGNVTLNGAALSLAIPSITSTAGTPQSATVNTPFGTALQAVVKSGSNNSAERGDGDLHCAGHGSQREFQWIAQRDSSHQRQRDRDRAGVDGQWASRQLRGNGDRSGSRDRDQFQFDESSWAAGQCYGDSGDSAERHGEHSVRYGATGGGEGWQQ